MVVIDTEAVQALEGKRVHSTSEGGSLQLHVQGFVTEILHVALSVASIWPPEFGSRMRVQSIARCEISIDHNSVARWCGTSIPKDGIEMQNENSFRRSSEIELHLKGFRQRIRVDLSPVVLHGTAANNGIKRSGLVGGPVFFRGTLAHLVEDRTSGFVVLGKLRVRTVLASNIEDIDRRSLRGNGAKEHGCDDERCDRNSLHHQDAPRLDDTNNDRSYIIKCFTMIDILQ